MDLLFCILLGFGMQEVEYSFELQAPAECAIGQLVILRATAPDDSDIKWEISPVTENFQTFENNRVAVFTSPAVGEYLVIAACATNGKVELLMHRLTVVKEYDTFKDDLIKAVKAIDHYSTAAEKQAVIAKLANLFEILADSTEAEVLTTVQKSIKEILGEDQKYWEPVLDIVGLYLDYLAEQKTLTIEDYQKTWKKVANALEIAGDAC